MIRKWKMGLPILAAALLGVLVLSGCESSDPTPSPTAPPASAATPTLAP